MKKGASIAAPDEPDVWHMAASMYKLRDESFMARDYIRARRIVI
jgi:hypothetical protein